MHIFLGQKVISFITTDIIITILVGIGSYLICSNSENFLMWGIERKKPMTHAEVTSLIQTLEYLEKFPCILFKIKIIQAKGFNKKVDEVIKPLKLAANERDHRPEQARLILVSLRTIDYIRTVEYDLEWLLLKYPVRRENTFLLESLQVGSFICRISHLE